MTRAEMRQGLLDGRKLIQEEWASRDEKNSVEVLISEGVCTASAWKWKDDFQCMVRYIVPTPRDRNPTRLLSHENLS